MRFSFLFVALVAAFLAFASGQSPSPIDVPATELNISTLNMTDPEAVRAALLSLQDAQAESDAARAAELTKTNEAINNGWALTMGTLVFFMQVGFTSLEAGSVAWKRSVPEIIIKNVATTIIAGFMWYLVGYGIAFGNKGTNGFIGDRYFALNKQGATAETSFGFWFFQYTFAAAGSTIVSGAMAERARISTYFLFTAIMAGFIYPVVAHWAWSTTGWMSAFNPARAANIGNGYVDFAGSGVVHMVGGTAALVMAYMVGPRKNRFTDTWQRTGISLFNSQDPSWIALGCFFLWFGWFGFNGGSTLALANDVWRVSALVFANTLIASCSGGVTGIIWPRVMEKTWSLNTICNCVLAGLVAITAPCAVVEPWSAFIIGILGATAFYWVARLLVKLKIDDPVDASPLHFSCGVIGVLCVGLFMSPDEMLAAYGRNTHYGLLLGGGGQQLAIQIIGVLVISAWSGGITFAFAFVAQRLGLLRMSKQKEDKHYEDHLFANKAEEGFAAVVTFNKNKGAKSIDDLHNDSELAEDAEALADMNSDLEESKSVKGNNDNTNENTQGTGKHSTTTGNASSSSSNS